MNSMMNKVLIGLALGLMVASSAAAQRGMQGDRPARPGAQQEQRQQRDGMTQEQRTERLKGMLESRLEQLREQEAKLESALAMLEKGQRPEIEPWMLRPQNRVDGQQRRQRRPQQGQGQSCYCCLHGYC